MLRKIVIGTVIVLGLLVLALVALVLLVDVNRFKPQIQQAVKERTNRNLAIEGNLSLKVLPRIAVALPRTTLSEPGSDKPFAALQSARVSVALLPLLGGRVEASKISIDGLAATIERRADGSTNVDDLLRVQDKGAAPTEAKKGVQAGGAPQFEIGGMELTNANLTLRDLASKNTIALKQLNLEAGRIATVSRTPLRLTTQFSSTSPAMAGSLDVRGDIELDLVKQAFGAQGLNATMKGSFDKQPMEASLKADRLAIAGSTLRLGDVALTARGTRSGSSFEAQLNAPDVQVTETEARGQRLTAAVKLSGAHTANLQLALEGLSGTAKDLKIGKLALTGTLEQRVTQDRLRRIVANLASPATASFEAQSLALPQLDGEVTIEDPALPGKSARMPVNASIALDAKKELLDAKLTSKFDETALNLTAGVRGFSPLRVNFNANADRLNVDRYFPPASAAATPASAPASGSSAPRQDAPVDLSALKGLNLNGEVNVGQLQARGIKTQNLRAVLKAANGRLDIAPLTAALYGGTLNANASAQAEGNRIASSIALTGISIQPLMKDALNKDLLEGRGNVRLDITTGGSTVNGLKKNLDGSGAIMLRDGAFKGINIGAKLRQAQALLGRGGTETQQTSASEKTDFTELTASFTINNGIATSNDLDVKSPLLRISGAGQVDIPAGTLDYTVRAMVVNTATGQEGKELAQLRGVTIPVKLSGPFDKLGYSIDWTSAAQEALKTRAAEQLKDKAAPQLDEQKKKLEQRARDAFKGLLGR
jgi:AsmA protein